MLALVVGGDGNVDALEIRVSVGEGNNGDVHVPSFANSLVVSTGISDNEQTGLIEALLQLIGEGTGSMASNSGLATGIMSELEDTALAVRASRDGSNVLRVLNGNNHAGSELELLPSLAEVEYIDTVVAATVDIALHVSGAVLGTQVALGRQKHLQNKEKYVVRKI